MIKHKSISAAVTLVALLFSSAVAAQATAAMPEMAGARLSPDGTHMAYLRPHQGEVSIAIEDLRPGGRTILVPPVEDLDFSWVRWANDKRLVIAMEFYADSGYGEARQTRLIASDRDGTNIGSIIEAETRVKTGSRVPADLDPAHIQDDVIDWLPDDPKHILVSLDADHDDKMEVRKINVRNGKFKVYQEGLPGVQSWLADADHDVRLGWGELGDDPIVWYGRPDSSLRRSQNIEWFHAGFRPIAFADDPDTVYAYGEDVNGRASIRKLNLVSGEFTESVFEQADADANSLLMDLYTGKAVGVSFTDLGPSQRYFDGELQRVQRTIDKAVPNASNRVVSTSADRRQVLVYSQDVEGTGTYYYWDRDAKSFEMFGAAMRGWAGEFSSSENPVRFVASEGF